MMASKSPAFFLLRALPHVAVTAWRCLRGGLSVFRDRPLWFVSVVAVLPDNEGSLEKRKLVQQARTELALRTEALDTLQYDDPKKYEQCLFILRGK